MITVSKMYFEEGLNQEDISKKLNISVPQISRIINAAKEQGYVKTYVVDPFSESNNLTKQLISSFNLKDAKIIENVNNLRLTQTYAAQAGADYLLDILKANDIVSIAYSDIIYKIPHHLPKVHIENLSFVQPNGSLFEQVKGYQYDTLRETSTVLDAYYYYFPSPAIVQSRYIKDALHKDPIISWVLDLAKKSNIALYSTGHPSSGSVYVENGYFTESEITQINEKGAVGEIFGHFINKDGEIFDRELDDRVIGMDISELKTKDYSVCLSVGEHLAPSIYATLKGGYCNVLITDTLTARKILSY